MGNVTFGVPEDLALELKKSLNCNVFIETGTYKGNTALWASRNFRDVYTIEYVEERYDKAVSRITNMKDTENIRFLLGNSKDKLKEILDNINEPVIFWLDAHGLGKIEEITAIEDEIPLMKELSVILDWQDNTNQDCCILIDDSRLFLNPPPVEKGYHPEFWPNYGDICHEIDVNLGLYDDSYPDDKDGKYCIWNFKDVIVITPVELEKIVLDWSNK